MSAPTEEERLEFQHRKLKAEVAVLERPWYRSGTAILTGVAVVTSLLGSGVQFARSQRQFDLATIKYERTQLDIAKLELEKKRNDSLVALAAKDIAILSQLRHGEEAKLTRAESSLAVLQRNLANPKGTTELYHSLAVKALAVVVDQLRDARRDQPRIDLAARDAAGRVEQLRSSGPQSVVAAKPAASAARPYWIALGYRLPNSLKMENGAFGDSVPKVGALLKVPYHAPDDQYSNLIVEKLYRPSFDKQGNFVGGLSRTGEAYAPGTALRVVSLDTMPWRYPSGLSGEHTFWALVVEEPNARK